MKVFLKLTILTIAFSIIFGDLSAEEMNSFKESSIPTMVEAVSVAPVSFKAEFFTEEKDTEISFAAAVMDSTGKIVCQLELTETTAPEGIKLVEQRMGIIADSSAVKGIIENSNDNIISKDYNDFHLKTFAFKSADLLNPGEYTIYLNSSVGSKTLKDTINLHVLPLELDPENLAAIKAYFELNSYFGNEIYAVPLPLLKGQKNYHKFVVELKTNFDTLSGVVNGKGNVQMLSRPFRIHSFDEAFSIAYFWFDPYTYKRYELFPETSFTNKQMPPAIIIDSAYAEAEKAGEKVKITIRNISIPKSRVGFFEDILYTLLNMKLLDKFPENTPPQLINANTLSLSYFIDDEKNKKLNEYLEKENASAVDKATFDDIKNYLVELDKQVKSDSVTLSLLAVPYVMYNLSQPIIKIGKISYNAMPYLDMQDGMLALSFYVKPQEEIKEDEISGKIYLDLIVSFTNPMNQKMSQKVKKTLEFNF